MHLINRRFACIVLVFTMWGSVPAYSAEPAVTPEASGWELPVPTEEATIPDAIALRAEISHEPNTPGPLRYYPSQNLAAFPQRLLPGTRELVQGITQLAPDRQEPIAGGFRFFPGKEGYFEIHHRRAGVRCNAGAVFTVRMEFFRDLATVVLGVRSGQQLVRLDQFEHRSFEVYPGRVRYVFHHADLKLSAEVEAVAPAAVPAYGVLARVKLTNEGTEARAFDLVALAAPGGEIPAQPPDNAPAQDQPHLQLHIPKKESFLHDTNYDVFVGLDGKATTLGKSAVQRRMELPGGASAEAYLTVFIDSPGFDEPAVTKQIEGYFEQNPNLPPDIRHALSEAALDTYARIVVNGDAKFRQVRDDGGAAFKACCRAWETGIYRREAVRFELPDKKLASLANLAANDLFPGIVQPPGLVHDAKHGDGWNYIFCYRHDHAASDVGLDSAAIDYLRLLSCHQTPQGCIQSLANDFKSQGHSTRFEESYIDALYHYYKWTGDVEAVRQLWPTVTLAAKFLDSWLDPDGDGLYRDVLHQWKSDFDARGPSSSFQTALVHKDYLDLAEFATVLGKPQEAQQYQKKAEQIEQAVQQQLWSDEFAMLGPKCPLGILRLHPESLEVEIPVWTKLVDPYQAAMLTDWYLTNVSFRDDQGGLWMYHNDWWPVVWTQHLGAPSDIMMVAWAMSLTGQYDQGCKVLQTMAAGSCRHESPGFDFTFSHRGVQGGGDPATALGAFFRAMVEGVFGVEPHLDQKRIVIHPRFPKDWDHARFQRPGLDMDWRREGNAQIIKVKVPADVRAIVELSTRSAVTGATVNGKPAKYEIKPEMRHAAVAIELPLGGGEARIETAPEPVKIDAPLDIRLDEVAEVRFSGLDAFELEDRYHFFEQVSASADQVKLKLKRTACGRAVIFAHCREGNAQWIEPVTFSTLPPTAKEVQRRTVIEPLPANTHYVPVDLSAAYRDDIQTYTSHYGFQWDHTDGTGGLGYWTMPGFKLQRAIPRRVHVGEVPFLLGQMGPGEAEQEKDLLMIGNTRPYKMATRATFAIGRQLHKIYLLSLNMNLPQKCYVPALAASVKYADGTESVTELVPPLNFDSYYQDFGINTMALPLPAGPAEEEHPWPRYGGVNLGQIHLTMADIPCDPAKKVVSLELRSIATETYFGLAGMTLAEVSH